LSGGLILAAGAGTRYAAASSGGPAGAAAQKLLADLDGKPLVQHAVDAMAAVDRLGSIAVVVGAGADELLRRVRFDRCEPVLCGEWQHGQAASLRCGVTWLAERGAERVVVTLGDQPGVTPALIERFLDAEPGTRAVYGGRPGHPVLLGRDHMSALPELTGDRGARDLLRGGPTIECGEVSSGRDVDTPEDLEAIRDETRAVL
jgi:molybdenum cofactor cytidylyltransferase